MSEHTPEQLSEQRIQAIRERCRRATEGPWEVQDSNSWRRIGRRMPHGRDGDVLCPTYHPKDHHPDLIAHYPDLHLMAAAREDIPALLSEIDRLKRKCGES